jgi:DNA-binding CsgD family transcriptional regulator
MKKGPVLDHLTRAIVQICRSGVPPTILWERVLGQLRRAVPFDAAFWATVDPATLLFTQPRQEEIPTSAAAYFIHNEFIADDVNKWTTLARDRIGVRTLLEATAGQLQASPRYRDVFRPLGLGDELRAVFRSAGACWGYMCLHREAGGAFSRDEILYVHRIASHVGDGIRSGHLVSSVAPTPIANAPGLVVLDPNGALVSVTMAGERWLAELGHPDPERTGVPLEFRALAAALQALQAVQGKHALEAALPRLRVKTRGGRWALLHASPLPTRGTESVAVIIEEASAGDVAPILMMAYGLTKREQMLTGLICRGASTREIAAHLSITANTVQDHLKSIFDKTGVRSRRELVAKILQEQYLPRARTGRRLGPSGFFVD